MPRFSLKSLFIAVSVVAVLLGIFTFIETMRRQAFIRAFELLFHGRMFAAALAMRAYDEQHGQLPDPRAGERTGLPPRSWRVEVLPYLEHPSAYQNYDPKLNWNDPANSQSMGVLFPEESPFSRAWSRPMRNEASMVVVAGPSTLFPPEGPLSLAKIGDRPGETILLIEYPNQDLLWYEPRDLTVGDFTRSPEDPQRILVQGQPFRKSRVAFVDNQSAILPADLDFDTLMAMLTANGGEEVDMNSWRNR